MSDEWTEKDLFDWVRELECESKAAAKAEPEYHYGAHGNKHNGPASGCQATAGRCQSDEDAPFFAGGMSLREERVRDRGES